MTVHPLMRTDARSAFLSDLWALAVRSIGSWALEVESTPAPSMTIVTWAEEDEAEYTVDQPLIARALNWIATGSFASLHPSDRHALLTARRLDCVDDLNRRQVSTLIQLGLWREVRYPDAN